MTNQMLNDNIIKLLGLEALAEEEKLGMLDQMTEVIQKRLLIRILDSLTPEKQAEYEQLLDKEDQDAINNFLHENVPSLQDWTFEEITTLKLELKDRAAKLDQDM